MNRTERLIGIVALFFAVYTALYLIFVLVAPGEAFRFWFITEHAKSFTKETVHWMNLIVPHWRIYYIFNFCYVGLIVVSLIRMNKKWK